ASATEELDKSVGTDFIVMQDTGQPIPPQAVERVKSVSSLERVTEYKVHEVALGTPDGERVTGKDISAADPTYATDLRVETVQGDLADAYRPDSMSVPEKFAEDHGIRLGSTVDVAFDDGRTGELTVRAITTSDTVIDGGAMYTSIDT